MFHSIAGNWEGRTMTKRNEAAVLADEKYSMWQSRWVLSVAVVTQREFSSTGTN
jgi:hypothetical protein